MIYRKIAVTVGYSAMAVGVGLLTLGVRAMADSTLWAHRRLLRMAESGQNQLEGLVKS